MEAKHSKETHLGSPCENLPAYPVSVRIDFSKRAMNFGKLAMTPRARVKITDNAFCALVRPDLACNGICVREMIEFGIVLSTRNGQLC